MKITNNQIKYSYGDVSQVAQYLLCQFNGCRIMTLEGELGAGKTTLVRSMLRILGVTEVITSPTFTYVNAYRLPNGKIFYHFDLYRIEKQEDFIFAGFDEYLEDEDAWVIIEWPGVIKSLLDRLNVCPVRIEHVSQDERLIALNGAVD